MEVAPEDEPREDEGDDKATVAPELLWGDHIDGDNEGEDEVEVEVEEGAEWASVKGANTTNGW